jgi:membrane-associated protease RseP (regulator of RpoE activity)
MKAPLLLLLVGCLAMASHAFAADVECAEGAEAVGYIGITGIQCNCSVSATDEGRSRWIFRSEPQILHVEPDSPAGRAALQAGDVIVAINNQPITTAAAGALYGSPPPLEELDFLVRRGGQLIHVFLTAEAVCPDDPRLEHFPETPRAPMPTTVFRAQPEPTRPRTLSLQEGAPPAPPRADFDDLPRGWLGMGISCGDCSFKTNGEGAGWRFSEPPEVYSVDAGGPADRAGLRPGDVLTHLDGIPLVDHAGAERFSGILPGQNVTLTFEREGRERVVSMRALAAPSPKTPAGPVLEEPPAPARKSSAERALGTASPSSPQGALDAAIPAPAAAIQQLRFAGALGKTSVRVWGVASVVVTMQDGEIVIKTGDATIRLKSEED